MTAHSFGVTSHSKKFRENVERLSCGKSKMFRKLGIKLSSRARCEAGDIARYVVSLRRFCFADVCQWCVVRVRMCTRALVCRTHLLDPRGRKCRKIVSPRRSTARCNDARWQEVVGSPLQSRVASNYPLICALRSSFLQPQANSHPSRNKVTVSSVR